MHDASSSRQSRPLSFYALDESIFEVYWHEPPARASAVPEAVVQDLWRLQEFRTFGLQTVDGRPVEVLDPGLLNSDGGPDFLAAQVRIGDELLSGPVEIHVASTAWYEHQHETDPAYSSVILHVTLEHDLWTGRVRTSDGRILPELVLAPCLKRPIRSLLFSFYARGRADLPCAGRWHEVPGGATKRWLEQLAHDRLARRVRRLERRYLERPDLQQMLYELVLTGLGFAKNTVPMLELARRVPVRVLHEMPSVESAQAALLGTAGLLPDLQQLRTLPRQSVDYVMLLHEQFAVFREKSRISPMPAHAWQFFRLRPSNFPPVRVAQAGALAAPGNGGPLAPEGLEAVYAALRSPRPRSALEALFRVDPGPFWHAHVRLDRPARRGYPFIGRQRVHALVLNALSPVLHLRAELQRDEALSQGVHRLLAQLPPENDEITRTFQEMGATASNGLETQGIHQLYRMYCRDGGCLRCTIGRVLFGNGSDRDQMRSSDKPL